MALSLLLRSSSRLPGTYKRLMTLSHLRFTNIKRLRNNIYVLIFYKNKIFILALVNASRISCVTASQASLLSNKQPINVSQQVRDANHKSIIKVFQTFFRMFDRSQFHQFVSLLLEIM